MSTDGWEGDGRGGGVSVCQAALASAIAQNAFKPK